MPVLTYRYITHVPGVRSGRAVIEGTRIAVHDVVAQILNGADINAVVGSFPSITRAQVYEALAYYEDNKEEIDLLVAQQMAGVERRGSSSTTMSPSRSLGF